MVEVFLATFPVFNLGGIWPTSEETRFFQKTGFVYYPSPDGDKIVTIAFLLTMGYFP
jgi:hypothetical protein